jgi:hypothetical protein
MCPNALTAAVAGDDARFIGAHQFFRALCRSAAAALTGLQDGQDSQDSHGAVPTAFAIVQRTD